MAGLLLYCCTTVSALQYIAVGSILQDRYHALFTGEIDILALYVLLYISLNLYVCHVAHLTVGNLNFFEKSYITTFSKNINVPP